VSPIDVCCDRVGCEAKPGERCRKITGAMQRTDRELQIAEFHQTRMWRAMGKCYVCKSDLADGKCQNENCINRDLR